MAKTQCIFLGDEIAAGVYNYMRNNYGYGLHIQYTKGESDRYDTPHFCYDFNRWRWDDNDDVRYAPWYVISTGLHDNDKDYYQDMYEIRNKIRHAREGFSQPSPKVVWIVPGAGTGAQNTVIKNNINRVNTTFGGNDIVLNELFTWSQSWVPAAFFPSGPSNLVNAYRALGYGAFPYANPVTKAMVDAASSISAKYCVSTTVTEYVTTTTNVTTTTVIKSTSLLQWLLYGPCRTITTTTPVTKTTPVTRTVPPALPNVTFNTIATNATAQSAFTSALGAAASTLFTVARAMNANGLGNWNVSDLYSTFEGQLSQASMAVPPYYSGGMSYSQFQSLYPNRSLIQEDRTHPTAQGNSTLASRILQLTNYFTR